ncbi:unnamed protein product [Nyctereutes procyonoides]|uniref:(raccoon dog) hypothetical protein n=1 Tax=Nyctereutes procyonoides TaxID=34880 RepID=A0A811Z430_NYCPR|nr:unnamed protein product [Nyctereutes procyonoides]
MNDKPDLSEVEKSDRSKVKRLKLRENKTKQNKTPSLQRKLSSRGKCGQALQNGNLPPRANFSVA